MDGKQSEQMAVVVDPFRRASDNEALEALSARYGRDRKCFAWLMGALAAALLLALCAVAGLTWALVHATVTHDGMCTGPPMMVVDGQLMAAPQPPRSASLPPGGQQRAHDAQAGAPQPLVMATAGQKHMTVEALVEDVRSEEPRTVVSLTLHGPDGTFDALVTSTTRTAFPSEGNAGYESVSLYHTTQLGDIIVYAVVPAAGTTPDEAQAPEGANTLLVDYISYGTGLLTRLQTIGFESDVTQHTSPDGSRRRLRSTGDDCRVTVAEAPRA